MPIIADLQALEHDARITLFTLGRYNPASPNEKFYFTNNIGVSFGGRSYNPLPCEIAGLEMTSEGALPRPTLTVADPVSTDGGVPVISSLVQFYGGLEGAELELSITLKTYLDGEANADPTAVALYDSYLISQRIQEVPGDFIEFELASAIDFVDEKLPGRYCIKKCPWLYRGSECGYSGTAMFDLNNARTADPAKDNCAKSVTACSKRFGKTAVLPFGGFPALLR